MPKVEFQTEQNERFKAMWGLITEKYGAYLTPEQVSEATGYKRCTVYEMVRSGQIPAKRSKGKTGKITVSAYDLVKFMEHGIPVVR